MDKKYNIILNEKQLRLMAQALEMQSRMICGQIEESFLPPIRKELFKELGSDKFGQKRDSIESVLSELKNIVWGLEPNASYGIGYDQEADLGYEMYKEILHQFELENKEECQKSGEKYFYNVHSDKPCLTLTSEPKIKIEVHNEGK